DLLGVVDGIDDQAERAFVGLQNDDIDLARGDAVACGFDLQLAVEGDQREQVAAEAVDRGTVDQLDAFESLLAIEADQLEQAGVGDGGAVAAAGDGQRRDDGQGQGDFHLDRRAPAEPALDIDGAADLLDVGADDVHANAPAGELGDAVGSRETGQEDEVDQVG